MNDEVSSPALKYYELSRDFKYWGYQTIAQKALLAGRNKIQRTSIALRASLRAKRKLILPGI